MPELGTSRRAFRWLLVAVVATLAVMVFRQAGITPGDLWRPGAADRLAIVLTGLRLPLDDGAFWQESAWALVDTVAIAGVGTALALLIGGLLAVFGSRAVVGRFVAGESPIWPVRGGGVLVRGLALLLRSIPEVIIGCVLVRVLGLGPAAAVGALALAYGGMIAKVWGEQLETVRGGAATALAAGGAGPLAQLVWARLPDALPGFAGYATYRFECAVRASAILGYVGGGGLGQAMDMTFQAGDFGRLLAQIILLIAAVAVVEVLADRIQARLR